MRKSLLLFVCLLAALVAVTPLQAQQSRSGVSGQVMDNTTSVRFDVVDSKRLKALLTVRL